MTALPAQLSARTLRDLASALLVRSEHMEATTPRRELTPEGIERLADIVAAGSRPSVGFWLRHSTGRRDA